MAEDEAEIQRQRESFERIGRVFQTIHNEWARSNSFQYSVRSSESVKGKTIDEIRDVKFLVGAAGQNEELTLNELASLFLFVADQTLKLKAVADAKKKGLAPDDKQLELSSTVHLKPTDEQIASVLRQIQIRDPDEQGKFNLTQDRMDYVMEMVRKKANAAIGGRVKGNHFYIFPPQAILDQPETLNESEIFDRLKDTVWWVRWYDDTYDQVSFGEFLTFIDQIHGVKRAFEKAASVVTPGTRHRQSKYSGGWTPKKDRSRKPKADPQQITVKGSLDTLALVMDARIRQLMSTVVIERRPRPQDAVN